MNLFNYKKRDSWLVSIGDTPMGGKNPIRIQSMTNTSTLDSTGSILQCMRIIDAGGEYVRLTAQGVAEARNLKNIRDGLRAKGYSTPLIADIHFNPKAAETAAEIVEKVRINPGNFVSGAKHFRVNFSDEEYQSEIEKIRERLLPFLKTCRTHNTAIRIGVNHGSLSDRIMSRYGDTPEGMVESCMEFLRICIEEDFSNVVISIKASNTSVMVRTVRLMVQEMEKEKMAFPIHLGVTEAGDGEDGRIKSAVGIGSLLWEGIGDTIRVSLSEDPEKEIPVAKLLADYVEKAQHPFIEGKVFPSYDPIHPTRRTTIPVDKIGGESVPIVISTGSHDKSDASLSKSVADYLYIGTKDPESFPETKKLIIDRSAYKAGKNRYPLFRKDETNLIKEHDTVKFLMIHYAEWDDRIESILKQDNRIVIIIKAQTTPRIGEQKAFIHRLMNAGITNPVILYRKYNEPDPTSFQVKAGADCGAFFLDMMADGIFLDNEASSGKAMEDCAFGILQATGRRISKTEYISCPSCGRTLFDLQTAIRKVKAATSHLKELKIGIMGCIVNGPGEMADADYGYVGAGKNKISLYKGKMCIEKNIPEEEAVERLIDLIKKNGDWKEIT